MAARGLVGAEEVFARKRHSGQKKASETREAFWASGLFDQEQTEVTLTQSLIGVERSECKQGLWPGGVACRGFVRPSDCAVLPPPRVLLDRKAHSLSVLDSVFCLGWAGLAAASGRATPVQQVPQRDPLPWLLRALATIQGLVCCWKVCSVPLTCFEAFMV